MAFWGSDKIDQVCRSHGLVKPFDKDLIVCCSYELPLGNEAYVTSFPQAVKRKYRDGDQIVIEPGQFGILLSKSKVKIPLDAIGLISIKAGQKFRGLVNVSGFHVDPDFEGYLKFSVYNAGSQNINLTVGDPLFLIWFSDVDQNTKGYSGNHAGKPEITSQDVMRIQGDVDSPAALALRIKSLEDKMRIAIFIIVVIFCGLFVAVSGDFVVAGIKNELNPKKPRPPVPILQSTQHLQGLGDQSPAGNPE